MEEDTVIDVHLDDDTESAEFDDEILAARPKGGSDITDGTSNT